MFVDNTISSRLYEACVYVTKMMVLTMLFTIFSLPIITIGASLTALVAAIRKSEYPTIQTFLKSFTGHLIRSFPLLIFSILSVMFLLQIWHFIGIFIAGRIIFLFLTAFLLAYNLNAFLLVDLIQKSNIMFFRQVFYFTVGTFYKTFFVPMVGILIGVLAPIVGGLPFLLLSLPIVLSLYVRWLRSDLKIVEKGI